jgi:MFS family permease
VTLANAETASVPWRESRGWTVVFAGCIGCGAGLAALPFYGLSSFMAPLEREFGWTRTQIGLASTCLTVGVLVSVPFIGRACDRFGVRALVLPSIVLLAAALASLSLIGPHVWTLYAGYLLAAVLGAGTTPVSYATAVAGWFSKHRGLALGVTLAGTGLSGFFAPRILTEVIVDHGWRAGWLAMAALSLIALPVTLLFLRDPPVRDSLAAPAHEPVGFTLSEAVHSYRFWIIAAAFFTISLGISGVIINMIPLLLDAGLSAAQAAQIASFIGVGVIVARLTIGYVVDRVFAPVVGAVVFLITGAGCWLLATAGPAVAPYAAGVIGFAMGAEVDLIAYLVSRYFGLKHYGAINGCSYASYNAGAAFSPFLVGALFSATGGYALALQLTAALCAIGGLTLLALGAYPSMESGQAPFLPRKSRTHSAVARNPPKG